LPTICDGVAVPFTTEHLFPLLSRMVDRVVTVSEIMVREAIGLLATNRKLVAEGAGALSVAAALAIPERERGRTVCLVTGGSIDRELLCEILGGLR
jgi:threonine dehydratase